MTPTFSPISCCPENKHVLVRTDETEDQITVYSSTLTCKPDSRRETEQFYKSDEELFSSYAANHVQLLAAC